MYTYPHYDDVITSAMASQMSSLTTVYSSVCSGTYERKHESSASLAFVGVCVCVCVCVCGGGGGGGGIHRWPANSLHQGPVTRKMFPFDDVIILNVYSCCRYIRFAVLYNCATAKTPTLIKCKCGSMVNKLFTLDTAYQTDLINRPCRF